MPAILGGKSSRHEITLMALLVFSTLAPSLVGQASAADQANMSLGTDSLLVVPGRSAQVTASITSTVEDTFVLYAEGLPNNVGARFDPPVLRVEANQTSTANLTVTAGLDSDPGNFTLVVNALGHRTSAASEMHVTVIASVDLVVRRVWTEPASPSIGESVVFGANIANAGVGPAPDFEVDFIVSDTIQSIVTQHGLGPRQECDTRSDGWTADGNATLTAKVDPENQIIESDESNNALVLDVLVGVDHYRINVVVDPTLEAPATLSIDLHGNVSEKSIIGGASYQFDFETTEKPTIRVQQTVLGEEGSRYVTEDYVRYFDQSETWRISYRKEFRLTVSADVNIGPECLSQEWFGIGETALVRFCPIYKVSEGTRYALESIDVDGRYKPSNLDSLELVMDQKHNIVLHYSVEYYLRIDTDYGEVKGGNAWCPANSTVSWSVRPKEVPTDDLWTVLRMTWKADPPEGNITLRSPVNFRVQWVRNYTPFILNLFCAIVAFSIGGLVVTECVKVVAKRMRVWLDSRHPMPLR